MVTTASNVLKVSRYAGRLGPITSAALFDN